MKLATMAVGATAALITGGLVWLAVREEKPAAKTTGSGGATKTTPAAQPEQHQSIDQIVDIIHGSSRGLKLPGQQTPADQASPDPNDMDAAIAVLAGGLHYDQSVNGNSIQGVASVAQGQRVWKFGRTTGMTWGTVGSTHVKYLPVKYPNANANGTDLSIFFNDQIEVFGDTQQFSQGGDSGSVVFDQANRAVGLLFAGIDPSTNNPLASMINLKQASEAQDKLGPKLMVEPWFRGIAVLADDAGSHYLKVNVEAVTEAVRAKLPADVDGVPIRIDAIGDPHPV